MDDYKYLNLGSFFLMKSRVDKTILGSLNAVSSNTYKYSVKINKSFACLVSKLSCNLLIN